MTVTWNPFDKADGVTLTNGNLTATANTNNSNLSNVRANLGRNAGKWVFEITSTVSHSAESSGFGFANATASLTAEFAGGTNNSTGYYKDEGATGEVYLNNAIVDTAGPRVTAIPATWMVACDLDNLRWWPQVGINGFIKNGVTVDITATNPVDSFPLTALGSGLLYPFLQLAWLDSCVVNLGASPFLAPIPTGFFSWDGSQPAIIGRPTTTWTVQRQQTPGWDITPEQQALNLPVWDAPLAWDTSRFWDTATPVNIWQIETD